MFDLKKIKHLKKLIDSLTIKYDMFFSNRQYKNVHFKDEEEYNIIQKNLSSEIEIAEKAVSEILKEWFQANFDSVQFLAYDSRFICINRKTHRIGKVLLKHANEINLQKVINKKFNEDTDLTLIAENYEDLPEDIQKAFTF